MLITSINPATEEVIANYEEMTKDELLAVVDASQKDFKEWRHTSFQERSNKLHTLARCLRDDKAKLAELITLEMGKPLREAEGEVEKCAWVCEFYADKAEDYLKPEYIETEGQKSWVAFQPIGLVLGIMPWNFPLWQVFRFAAPAVMAGNGCLVKHAPNVTGCALAIDELFKKAGYPDNLYKSLLISIENVNERVGQIIQHPDVRAVTLTGSTGAGQKIAEKSGHALKKTVLELGGSDPYIILEDADLDEAINSCVFSRLQNAGQSCVAAKRYLVSEKIKAEFEQKLIESLSQKVVGDPMDPKTDIGPMARLDLRDELHSQVDRSVAKGAKVLIGGQKPERKGYYYPPTVLTDIGPEMPVYYEETFGPVASIISFKTDQEALEIANDSPFGLGSAVFSKNIERAQEIASQIEAGLCFINSMVKSDPRLPFGGIKDSGYGRELSYFGIREFVNIKTVFIK
jgi:succinate-semialdehyde dehydrogenase/glutarate-semialdehyde dehydrogenase